MFGVGFGLAMIGFEKVGPIKGIGFWAEVLDGLKQNT